jgi:hypothetical protein
LAPGERSTAAIVPDDLVLRRASFLLDSPLWPHTDWRHPPSRRADAWQARERASASTAAAAEKLIADARGGFDLGDREPKGGEATSGAIRARLDEATERMR